MQNLLETLEVLGLGFGALICSGIAMILLFTIEDVETGWGKFGMFLLTMLFAFGALILFFLALRITLQ